MTNLTTIVYQCHPLRHLLLTLLPHSLALFSKEYHLSPPPRSLTTSLSSSLLPRSLPFPFAAVFPSPPSQDWSFFVIIGDNVQFNPLHSFTEVVDCFFRRSLHLRLCVCCYLIHICCCCFLHICLSLFAVVCCCLLLFAE